MVILVIWSFVKIENGFGQNRHYNIKIYFYIIVSEKSIFQIENDKWPNDHLDHNVKKTKNFAATQGGVISNDAPRIIP